MGEQSQKSSGTVGDEQRRVHLREAGAWPGLLGSSGRGTAEELEVRASGGEGFE